MLEVFDWTGDTVFESADIRVVAAIDPSWNHLDKFMFRSATFGLVYDGHNIVLRQGRNTMQLRGDRSRAKTGQTLEQARAEVTW